MRITREELREIKKKDTKISLFVIGGGIFIIAAIILMHIGLVGIGIWSLLAGITFIIVGISLGGWGKTTIDP